MKYVVTFINSMGSRAIVVETLWSSDTAIAEAMQQPPIADFHTVTAVIIDEQ